MRMLWKISCLKFFAKPVDAFALAKPAVAPQKSDKSASTKSIRPIFAIVSTPAPSFILFTRSAVINGISVSTTASAVINTNESIVGVLNSLTHPKNRFNIKFLNSCVNVLSNNFILTYFYCQAV